MIDDQVHQSPWKHLPIYSLLNRRSPKQALDQILGKRSRLSVFIDDGLEFKEVHPQRICMVGLNQAELKAFGWKVFFAKLIWNPCRWMRKKEKKRKMGGEEEIFIPCLVGEWWGAGAGLCCCDWNFVRTTRQFFRQSPLLTAYSHGSRSPS